MKIAVLLSGGVDSSVVLGILSEQGQHELHAFYLKIWLESELHFLGECPWEEDLKYVKATCEQLNVPLTVVSLQNEYNDLVVQYAISELKAGRTPSPDIFCNQRVKFGAFLKHIDDSYDAVASGHYAKVDHVDGTANLYMAQDPVKDQTYFLSHLSQKQLSRCLFPLGDLPKAEVRKLATSMNLPTKDRPDSQGICFLGKIKFNDFVEFHLGRQTGEIRNYETNEVLGTHQGFWFHTFGQRKGLRLHGGPWFVFDKDVERNIVYVAHKTLLENISRDTFKVTEINWLSGEPPLDQTLNLHVKLRHGPSLIDAKLNLDDTKLSGVVELSKKDPGIANGQFAVFYKDRVCLGSGMIKVMTSP